MAVYTKLSFDEVKNLVSQYDIGNLESFRGIEEGSENSNYFVLTDKGKYILTLYEKRVTEGDLPFFLELTEHLGAQNIPCPLPVHNRIGGIIGQIKNKNFALVTFLSGKSVLEITPEHCRSVGRMLAEIHLAGKDFPLARENNMGIKTWRDLFAKTKARMPEIKGVDSAFIAEVLVRLEQQWPRDLPFGIIHADLFPDNVFFSVNSAKLSGVIDFYFACNDFFGFDLAICLNSWCFDESSNFIKERAAAMFAGYNSVRKITQAELKNFPLLALGAALRFFLTRSYDWLNPKPELLKKRDPLEYLAKLKFHSGVEYYKEYGF